MKTRQVSSPNTIQLVRKVRSGLSIQEAINQIVITSASELRQNILAKNEYGWTPEQAWSVIKSLSKDEKVCVSCVTSQRTKLSAGQLCLYSDQLALQG